MEQNNLKRIIHLYLKNQPAFFSLIRPIEGLLFQKNISLIKFPILDFGCGDGFFAKTVFEKIKIDVGIDLIENNKVNKARKNNVYKKIVLYDGNKLPFKDNSFNTIISNCVLEHVPQINDSLAEIYRVLKPNGYFIASVITNKWEDYLFGTKILGGFYKNFMRKKQEHCQLLTVNEWKEKFVLSGFKIEKIIGYLNRETVSLIDIFHYLSVPYLITNYFSFFYPESFFFIKLKKTVQSRIKISTAAGLFFVLKKKR